MNNKRKLRILNPAEMRLLTGGNEETFKCNKAGDTIVCALIADVKACKHFEGTCPSNFSSTCSTSSKISINCTNNFTITSK